MVRYGTLRAGLLRAEWLLYLAPIHFGRLRSILKLAVVGRGIDVVSEFERQLDGLQSLRLTHPCVRTGGFTLPVIQACGGNERRHPLDGGNLRIGSMFDEQTHVWRIPITGRQ